ncbi:MAG: J domain-containing protein [Chloroflexota bacterium]|nr:J domain-containing protein [Chloroflexota bacterium]
MEYKDYYKILEVARSADGKEVKKAFRRLARQYHPDANKGDQAAEEKFKEINEAYEVLSDPEKRRMYDRFGNEWASYQRAGGRPEDFDWSRWTGTAPGGGRVGGVQYGDFDDLQGLFGGGFSDFFQQLFGAGSADPFGGGQRGYTRSRKGQNYEQPVTITLQEAHQGAKRLLQLSGRRLEVKIPQGAATGTRVRIAGAGSTGVRGRAAGDLYLVVEVQPDTRFERRGDDLHTEVPADLYVALLGGEIAVPTLSGRSVMLHIPPETQNGKVFRLRGKGMPHLGNIKQHGDLYAKVQVQLPQHLTEKERQLFAELKDSRGK